jgi:hypothetical protein
MYYNLVNGIDVYQKACFPLFVSNLDLHFHALMSVNNKYYALQYIYGAFYVVRNDFRFVSNTGQLGTNLLSEKSVFVIS